MKLRKIIEEDKAKCNQFKKIQDTIKELSQKRDSNIMQQTKPGMKENNTIR